MMNPLMRCGAAYRGDAGRPAGVRRQPRRAARRGRAPPRRGRHHRSAMSPNACRSSSPAGCASASRSPRRLPRDPELLIADEPSTALDVTTQAEIIKLLKRVQEAARDEPDPHHPRPAARLLDLRPDLRALCRFGDGGRRYAPVSSAIRSIPIRSACSSRSRRPRSASRGSSPSAARCRRADEVAGRCSFRRPLRLGARRMPRGKAAACRGRSGTPHGLHPPRRDRRRDARAAQPRAARQPDLPPPPRSGGAARRGRRPGQDLRRPPRPPVQALKGVSIEVRPGESVGLVGESGSGKTTLGRCLVGLETATAGTIRIAGIDASRFAARGRSRPRRGCDARSRWSSRTPIRRSTRATRCAAA